LPPRTIVDPRFPARLRELRQARGLSLRDLAKLTYLGKSYLHDYETGRRAPSQERALHLDDALGAGGELAALVADGTGRLAYAVMHPRRADAAAVDELTTQLAAARVMEDAVGVAPMLPAVTGQLGIVGDLVRDARGAVRPRLVSVAAQWSQFGGWLNLAAGRRRRAGLLFDRALEWAVETGDRELTATVISFKGHAAWLSGDVGALIGLTTAALRDPAVYIGQRAYDWYQLARGHTLAGERKAALESLAIGADLAAETIAHTGRRPPWQYYRSRAFFHLEEGLVRQLLGDGTRAAELLSNGLAGLPPEMRGAEWTAMYRSALKAASARS
jgi:transcriptional regulator with XRE-family HTH domain